MKIEITIIEEMLGTASNNAEIHAEFIASKGPDAKSREEEIAALGVEEVTEKSMTVFPRENGQPSMWDYQIKGFFKDACGSLARVPDTRSSKLKAFRKVIDGVIFAKPRKIEMLLPDGGVVGRCQRPLRAQTAQGERIAIADSETVPAGTKIVFEVVCLNPALEATVREWLDYGKLRGFGQWRNSGKGRFEWRELAAE